MQNWKRGLANVGLAASLLSLVSCGGGYTPAPMPMYRPVPQGPVQYQPRPAVGAASAPGATKPAAKSRTPAKPGTTTGKTSTKPANSPAVPSGGRIVQVMGGLRQAWNATQTLQAHIISTDFDGTAHQVRTDADAEVAKPSRLWVRVTGGSDPDSAGTEVTWNGGDSVQVLTRVLGISTTVNLAVNDKRLTGIWDWSLADTSIARLMDTLLAPNAPVAYLGQARLGDQTVDLIELKTSVAPKATRERLGIDPQRSLPVLREIYRNDELMSRSQYLNLRPNMPVPHLGG